MKNGNTLAPMLNLYPDSIGGTLKNIAALLESEELRNTFGSIYVLPSICWRKGRSPNTKISSSIGTNTGTAAGK